MNTRPFVTILAIMALMLSMSVGAQEAPRAVDSQWEIPVEPARLDLEAISRAVDGQRFEQAFGEVRPAYAPYERLRSGLARYRNIERVGGWAPLPGEPRVLRRGDVDDALLRALNRPLVI